MAVDSLGAKGQPQFDGAKKSNLAADLTAIGLYAGQVGNRVVCTAAQMGAFNARFGFDPWDGLECFQSDTGDTFIYNGTTQGWDYWIQSGPVASDGYFTPSSGWSNGISELSTVAGQVAQVYVSFTRTGGTITVPSDGNLTNVNVGKVNLLPPFGAPLSSGYSGRLAQFVIDSSGNVQLTAVTPGTNIANGDGFSFGGLYLFR